MQNFVPLGTGNSRLMKSSIPAGTTWEQALAMLRGGTFPCDTGQLNAAGISQQGDPLNKNTLLKDATAQSYGGGATMVPDEVLAMLAGSLKVALNNIPTYLSDAPIGYTYQLHENGQPVDFIVVAKNYSGGVALARKQTIQNWDGSPLNVEWSDSNNDPYSESVLDAWLTNTYAPAIDENSSLVTASIQVYSGSSTGTSVTTISRKAFAPSVAELGGPSTNDGTQFEYNLLADFDDTYWTRTPWTTYTQAYYVSAKSSMAYDLKTETFGVRPIVVMPSDTVLYTTPAYTLQTPTGENVTDQVAQALGSVKVETGSSLGTETYGHSNPNSLTFSGPPILVWFFATKNTNPSNGSWDTPDLSFNDHSALCTVPMWALGTDFTVGPPYIAFGTGSAGTKSGYSKKSPDGKTLSWYNTEAPVYQLNSNVYEYFYIAFIHAGGES